MNGFIAIVLVCASTVAGSECDRSNALDVVVQPTATLGACAKIGQSIAAEAFGAPEHGRYYKIGCERRKPS